MSTKGRTLSKHKTVEQENEKGQILTFSVTMMYRIIVKCFHKENKRFMFPKKPFQKEKIQMQRRIKAYHPKTNPKKRKNVGAEDKRLPENHFFRSAISFCIIYPTTGHRPEMKD